VTRLARKVWGFGLVQLAGVIGLNAAGFWIASLIVRSDSSLVEMGLFAAANQVRNMASLAPALFTQTSLALLADQRHDPDAVMGASTCAAAFLSILLAGCGMAVLPWLLPAAYGASFSRAVFPACIALAIAVVHLSNGPSSARLTIVSLRSTTFINSSWALLVFGLGTLLLSKFAAALPAAAAMATYLVAHIVSAIAVTWQLRKRGCLPAGMPTLFLVPSAGAPLLLALASARILFPSFLSQVGFTLLLLLLTTVMAGFVFREGQQRGWAPRLPVSFRLWERTR
jgi:O-antigen/teichoic acid export membrane protein